MIPKQLQNDKFRFIKIKKNSKIPIESKWQDNNYKFNDKELIEWIEQGNNYGIINKSGNLLVIDADAKEIIKEVGKYLPETFVVETSNENKNHIYYNCPDMTDGKVIFRDGLGDIRKNGNYYTICPNSIHPNGMKYKVKIDAPITKITEKEIIAVLGKYKNKKPKEKNRNLEGKEPNGRHAYMLSEANRMFFDGYKLETVQTIITEINKRNHPPKSQNEVDNIVRDAQKHVEENQTRLNMLKSRGIVETDKHDQVTKIHTGRLAIFLLAEENLDFITFDDNSEIYLYDKGYGYFNGNAENIIKEKVNIWLGEYAKEGIKREVIGFIRDENYKNRGDFSTETRYVNLKNGVWDITEEKLLPHSPKYSFLYHIPIDYNPKAECPRIKKFFKEVLHPDDIDVMHEWFGYCLFRGYEIQKLMLLIGEGANGKSVMIHLLKTMLGKENVASKTIQQLSSNKFASSKLFGKLANISGEMKGEALQSTELLKQLCGGDTIDAEKKFKDSFEFVNYAKLIFSGNELPATPDETHAFFRRLIILTFPNKFEGKNADKTILQTLTTKKELEGLLRWSIEGLNRLGDNCEFSYNQSTDEVREYYKQLSDPVYAFCDEKLVRDTNFSSCIEKDVLLSAYNEWAVDKKFTKLLAGSFTQLLKRSMPEVGISKRGDRGNQVRVYTNLKWRENVHLF